MACVTKINFSPCNSSNMNKVSFGKQRTRKDPELERKEAGARRNLKAFLKENDLKLKVGNNAVEGFYDAHIPNVSYVSDITHPEKVRDASTWGTSKTEAVTRLCRMLNNKTITVEKEILTPDFFEAKA